jgi:hypothetical protein
VALVLLLAAVLLQIPRLHDPSAPPTPPLATFVLIEDWRVVVTVHSPAYPRTIKSVILQPEPKHKNRVSLPITHHTKMTLEAGDVRFTFEPLSDPFHIVITLDDGTRRRVYKKDWDRHPHGHAHTIKPMKREPRRTIDTT